MFDAVKLLGSMMQQGAAPSAQDRLQHAVRKGTGGGPLEQLAAQFGGSAGGLSGMLGGLLGQGGSRGFGEMVGNVTDLAKRAAASPRDEVARNNPAAIGGLGAIAGALLGGGRGAVGGGLMAVLGSLAYTALQGQGTPGQGKEAAPTLAGVPGYADEGAVQRKAMLMLRAMIQAAKADGQIDGREMQRITGKLAEGGESDAARQFVLQEMAGPVDIPALVRDVANQQEAAEVYAASLMAIEVDTAAERDYLARLAAALHLPQDAVGHIQATLGVGV